MYVYIHEYFCDINIGCCLQKLPPALCEKLRQDKSKWAMLKSRKGRWMIKVRRNCEGLISFQFGWPQFVHHYSLSVGDFVVFEHLGTFNFNVFVFDPSGCERELLLESNNEAAENPKSNSKSFHTY